MENPWKALPQSAPFLTEEDKSFLLKQKGVKYLESLLKERKNKHSLQFDILPDPYLGNFEDAKVIFLLLNPGFDDADVDIYKQDSENHPYIQQNRASLFHLSDPLFYVLNFKKSGGYKWWTRILKPLIEEEHIEIEDLSKKVMCIQYFPYHSTRYRHRSIRGKPWPSQKYSFEIVKNAVKEGREIVMMRGESKWLKAIDSLQGKYVRVKNYRNPTISRNNMDPKDYDEIVKLLKE